MAEFANSQRLVIKSEVLDELSERYDAGSANDDETLETIEQVHRNYGIVVDPHTAVGLAVADKLDALPGTPTVVLATAHPAKFPDAVARATGSRPELPTHLSDLLAREERFAVLPNSVESVREFIIRSTEAV